MHPLSRCRGTVRRRRRFGYILVIFLTLLRTAGAADAPKGGSFELRPVTPEILLDYVNQRGFTRPSVRWMPDSRHLILSADPKQLAACEEKEAATAKAGEAENASERTLWIALMDVSTGTCRRILEGGFARPSPDGKQIAYLAGERGNPQVWVSSLDGSDARPVTQATVHNPFAHWMRSDFYFRFAWSPDSRRIAVIFRPDRPRREQSSETKEGPTVKVIGGEGDVLPDSEIWLVDVEDGTSRKLTSGAYMALSNPSWTRDGRRFVFHKLVQWEGRTDVTTGEILSVDATTGEVHTVVKDAGVSRLRPSISPDGRYIGFTTDPTNLYYPDFWNIAVVPVEGGPMRQLTEGLFVSSGPIWGPDSKEIYFLVKEGAFNQFYVVTLGGEIRKLTDTADNKLNVTFSPDGRYMAYMTENLLAEQELRVAAVGGEEEHLLLDLLPQVKELALGQAREMRWKSRDGLEIAGFLVLPLNYEQGRQYPLIVDIHGGPVGGASLRGSVLVNTQLEWHMWAAKGYVVFAPDFRSSAVYGWEHIEAARENQDSNERDYDDIISGVDLLIEQGLVDPRRMVLVGHSYGAQLTNWIITQTNRFAAAVSYEGFIEYYLAYGTRFRIGGNPVFEWQFKGKPWEVPENYRRNAPIEYFPSLRTPTLLISGENGLALYHNEFLFTALRKQSVPAEFVVYEGEGHVIMGTENRRDLLTRVVGWVEQYSAAQSSASRVRD